MTQLLLDTHALLWWLAEPDRLSPAAYAAISDPANAVVTAHLLVKVDAVLGSKNRHLIVHRVKAKIRGVRRGAHIGRNG